MDYSHPLTTELFDRTPEQRAERAEIVAQLYSDGAEPRTIQARANKEMMDCFFGDVAIAAQDRVNQKTRATLKSTAALDYRAVTLAAHSEVIREIEELHEVLPFPNLDRLAGISLEYIEHSDTLRAG